MLKIQVRTSTLSAAGKTVTWRPSEACHGRVKLLTVAARAMYQQLNTYVTHEIEFTGNKTLSIGENRFLWKDKILEPVSPPEYRGGKTILAVKEV